MERKIKKTVISDELVQLEAPSGMHFENVDGQNLGKIIYDGITAKFRRYYKLVADEPLKNK